MTKAYFYSRCSGISQSEGDTFLRQREKVEAYAKEHDIEIVQEFRDEGVSGSKDCFDRDGLQDMFLAIKSNGVRLVLIENATRLARDLMVSEIILSECRKLGVKVMPVDSGIDLCVEDGDATRVLIRHILTAVSQWEKTMLVQKMRAAKIRIRRTTGKKTDGKYPYGTRAGEREVIGKMIAWRGAGLSFASIAKKLNSENIKPRKGVKWHPTPVKRILDRNS